MNEPIKIYQTYIRSKEYKGQRVATMWDVAVVHEVPNKTIRENFENNREHLVPGKHYFIADKNESFAYDLIESGEVTQNQINAAKDIPLFTEKGYLMIVKPLQGERAWKVQEEMIDKYFGIAESISELSPQLQLLINMELQQKKLKQDLQQTREEVQAIKDAIVINPKAEWRKETNRILNLIGYKLNNYKKPKDDVYEALKVRGKCRPSILVSNLKGRALLNGMSPSKADELNILDVLENEPRLREIYVSIVKEMAIKYGVA